MLPEEIEILGNFPTTLTTSLPLPGILKKTGMNENLQEIYRLPPRTSRTLARTSLLMTPPMREF